MPEFNLVYQKDVSFIDPYLKFIDEKCVIMLNQYVDGLGACFFLGMEHSTFRSVLGKHAPY